MKSKRGGRSKRQKIRKMSEIRGIVLLVCTQFISNYGEEFVK